MNTSTDQVLQTLETIRNADVGDLIKGLNKVFLGITQMDRDQVIAAYYTLDLCITLLNGDDEKCIIIKKFKEAVIGRMKTIVYSKKFAFEEAEIFKNVTGQKFYF